MAAAAGQGGRRGELENHSLFYQRRVKFSLKMAASQEGTYKPGLHEEEEGIAGLWFLLTN